MEKIPIFAGCHLATHPKSLFCGSKGTGLLEMVLLATWLSALEKLPCSSVLMMSTHRPNTDLTFLINEMKNLIVSPWDLFSSSAEKSCGFIWADASSRTRKGTLALVPAAFPCVSGFDRHFLCWVSTSVLLDWSLHRHTSAAAHVAS